MFKVLADLVRHVVSGGNSRFDCLLQGLELNTNFNFNKKSGNNWPYHSVSGGDSPRHIETYAFHTLEVFDKTCGRLLND